MEALFSDSIVTADECYSIPRLHIFVLLLSCSAAFLFGKGKYSHFFLIFNEYSHYCDIHATLVGYT